LKKRPCFEEKERKGKKKKEILPTVVELVEAVVSLRVNQLKCLDGIFSFHLGVLEDGGKSSLTSDPLFPISAALLLGQIE